MAWDGVTLYVYEGDFNNFKNKLGYISNFNTFPAQLEAAKKMRQRIISNFDKRGTEFSKREWVPRTRQYPWPLMQRTGALKGSWRIVYGSSGGYVAVESTVSYSRPLHYGAGRTNWILPARPLFKEDWKARKMYKSILSKHLKKAIDKRGPIMVGQQMRLFR